MQGNLHAWFLEEGVIVISPLYSAISFFILILMKNISEDSKLKLFPKTFVSTEAKILTDEELDELIQKNSHIQPDKAIIGKEDPLGYFLSELDDKTYPSLDDV